MTVSRKSKFLLLAAVCIAFAVWSGYRSEHRGMSAAGAPNTTVRTMVKRLVTPKAKRAGLDRLEELRQAIGRSHPTFRETAELWAVVRGFSLEEVKAALETLPMEAARPVNDEIADMLYYRWAQLDPEAAAAASVAENTQARRFAPYTVLSAWAQRDPEAAIRWGRESGHHMAPYAAMQLAALQWVTADPTTALSRAKAEFPDATRNVIHSLTGKLSGTPESRQRLFTLLAGEIAGDEERELLSRLAVGLGKVDAAGIEGLAGELAAAGWAEERVQQFRDEIRRRFRPVTSSLDTRESGDPAVSDETRRNTYSTWAFHHPQEALAWAEARGESELVSKTVNVFADRLLSSDWSPGRPTNNTWPDFVRKQFAAWRRMDPQAADNWLATMPADLRKTVNTPASDAAR